MTKDAPRFCTSCGKKITVGVSYCAFCGGKIQEEIALSVRIDSVLESKEVESKEIPLSDLSRGRKPLKFLILGSLAGFFILIFSILISNTDSGSDEAMCRGHLDAIAKWIVNTYAPEDRQTIPYIEASNTLFDLASKADRESLKKSLTLDAQYMRVNSSFVYGLPDQTHVSHTTRICDKLGSWNDNTWVPKK